MNSKFKPWLDITMTHDELLNLSMALAEHSSEQNKRYGTKDIVLVPSIMCRLIDMGVKTSETSPEKTEI